MTVERHDCEDILCRSQSANHGFDPQPNAIVFSLALLQIASTRTTAQFTLQESQRIFRVANISGKRDMPQGRIASTYGATVDSSGSRARNSIQGHPIWSTILASRPCIRERKYSSV